MRLEHLFDLDLRYEGDYTVVRPYGGSDGVGYAAGVGRALNGIEGEVRFSNHPRVRGDGKLLPDFAGDITTADGAKVVFHLTGLGAQQADGRSFRALAGFVLESDDAAHAWLNDLFCIADAVVRGRHVEINVYRCVPGERSALQSQSRVKD